MSSSDGTNYGYGVDSYAPQQYGMRNIAGQDGYASAENPPAYNDYETPRSRRRSSIGAVDDYHRRSDSWGEPGERSHRQSRYVSTNTVQKRGRNDRYDDYSDSEDDNYTTQRRGRDSSRSRDKPEKSRSLSRFGKRVSGFFGPDEHHDGEGNTGGKKWGATVAGALAGGLAGKAAKKDNWVPAAIGAFLGGFAAREAEKTYYRRREIEATREKRHSHRSGD